MKKKEEEKKKPSLTSLSTKTWFKTHIGSISFKTEHKLVSLCIAASNLSLKTVDKLKEYTYVVINTYLGQDYYDIHFDRTIIFRKTLMAR